MSDATNLAAPINQPKAPARTIRGIAAMIRSGAFVPDDAAWVSDALDKAADETDQPGTQA